MTAPTPTPSRRSLRPARALMSPTWWADAGRRASCTALAALLPLAGLLVAREVDLLYVVGVVALALLLSLVTSLAGLPEVDGRTVPAWLAVLTRVLKTAAQTVVAALVGVQLIQDVPWSDVWVAVAGASLTTLVRALMSYLPETSDQNAPADGVTLVPLDALEDPALAAVAAALGEGDPAHDALVRLGVVPDGAAITPDRSDTTPDSTAEGHLHPPLGTPGD